MLDIWNTITQGHNAVYPTGISQVHPGKLCTLNMHYVSV